MDLLSRTEGITCLAGRIMFFKEKHVCMYVCMNVPVPRPTVMPDDVQRVVKAMEDDFLG